MAAASLLPTAARAQVPAERPRFQVIVNVQNPATSLSRDEVSRLFLKKVTIWADGRAVLPVDLKDGSEPRLAFTQDILRRQPSAVLSYWQQRIFAGRDVPPPVCESEAEAIRFVEENPGAIAYVGPDAKPGPRARIINITEDRR